MNTVKNLNEEQLQAVKHGEGPLLIIAGAGTGKTTVITQRIKHLILEKKVAPSEILALTFTEKAAAEMEERVDVELPYGYTQLWIETFHAFCDRILRSEAIHIGLNPAYKLATEAESILFLRKNLFKLKFNYFRPLGNPYKFLQGFLTHVSRLRDDDITADDYRAFAEKFGQDKTSDPDEVKKTLELADAYKIYETLKAKEGIMDFSDLISNTLKLFRTRKNILSIYQNKFKYILVDEFQDTNFAQNEMAVLLAGKEKNITVVGDDDQSIYRWRGAAISNIIQFKKHFPKAKVIALTKNYRSTQEILDSAYKLIQFNNPDRLEIVEKIDKKLIATRSESGDPIEFNLSNRVENEAEFVAKKIKELVKENENAYTYKDFAILVRANDHAQPFVRAFERARIPYQFLGPGRLFHQEEIKDLIA
ncbi:UvrD-helicase domain-containing protein, partial [Patescibacteria group bacterium]|nr:UvrD-helicase domain-containing protein [Patescibacteria group bacterium]